MSGLQNSERLRIHTLLPKLIHAQGLDLRGLTVYTEAASGAYKYTPILAALAGAEHVYAATRDSAYATFEEVERVTLSAAEDFGVLDRVEVTRRFAPEQVGRCDIITNSGLVRPIDAAMIAAMKPTAVVPLMWETWEFRDSDLDLEACRRAGVLVLGSNETDPPNNMHPYSVAMMLKLLFDLGLEVYRSRVLLVGSGPGPRLIREQLPQLGVDLQWASDAEGADIRYRDFPGWLDEHGGRLEAMVLYEHQDPRRLLGSDGMVSFERLKAIQPGIRIGVISGSVRADELQRSELRFLPERILPFGFMSYQPYHLGPRPVLDLFAAGLKVGEAMARARLRGLSVQEAARHALEHSPAMDFPGEQKWG